MNTLTKQFNWIRVSILSLSILFSAQSAIGETDEHKVQCPQDGIGSTKGDVPALSVKTPKGHLLVCGYHEKTDSETLYSEFDLYSESNGKYSESLFQVGALDTYKMEPFSGGINLIELISFRGKQVAFQKLAMNCNLGNKCAISKANCETKAFEPFKTDILKRIKPFYKNGKNPSEEMITELSDLALVGDPDAIQVFQKNPGIKIDGATAEIFKKTQARLQHPCLKN